MKKILNELCPPLLKSMLSACLKRNLAWIGNFQTWKEAENQTTGYDADAYLAQLIEAIKIVRDDESKLERDSLLFDEIVYPYPLLSNLFALLTHFEAKSVFFLDFGGSLGSLYFQNRKFLRLLPAFTWNILEQEKIIQAGKEHFQTQELLFHSSLLEAKTFIKPKDCKILILSGVLQYLENPYKTFKEILREIDFDGILIDRTLFNRHDKHRIAIQKVPPHIYHASYACHLLSKTQFLDFFGSLSTRGGGNMSCLIPLRATLIPIKKTAFSWDFASKGESNAKYA